jgi:hypothetical protein
MRGTVAVGHCIAPYTSSGDRGISDVGFIGIRKWQPLSCYINPDSALCVQRVEFAGGR